MSVRLQEEFACRVVIWDDANDKPDKALVAPTTPSLALAAWHQAREDFHDHTVLVMKGDHVVDEPEAG